MKLEMIRKAYGTSRKPLRKNIAARGRRHQQKVQREAHEEAYLEIEKKGFEEET